MWPIARAAWANPRPSRLWDTSRHNRCRALSPHRARHGRRRIVRRRGVSCEFHVFFWGPDPALFSATICAYIPWCWRKPAMAINGRRNKPFGPGGSTRRLHQRGRTRIDEGVKDVLLLGMVPPLSDRLIVANDKYAPVALA